MKKLVVNLFCVLCVLGAVIMAAPTANAADSVASGIAGNLIQSGYTETTVASKTEAAGVLREVQAYIDAVSVTSETQKVTAKIQGNTMKLTLESPKADTFSADELATIYTDAGSTVESINNYIVGKLSYDKEAAKNVSTLSLASPQLTAKGALSTGKAVCQGYANLFSLLAENAGIKNVKIRGYVDGVFHVMNVVLTPEGTYMAADVTSNDSSNNNWSLMDFEKYCAKAKFSPIIDVETAFALKY